MEEVKAALGVGSVVEGRVTGVTNFGAFVELPEKKVGLVHISQIANTYVKDINTFVKIGDMVKVKILGAAKEGKYDLSIKQAAPDYSPEVRPAYTSRKPAKDRPMPGTFEDKITQFLKDSEEKLLDWKRNLQVKQNGGRKKKKKLKE
jgi:S1 RNA binding domain protein